MILLALALQTAVTPAITDSQDARMQRCVDLAVGDPAAAQAEASRWVLAGGGFRAQQCLGRAQTGLDRYDAAAAAFAESARGAAAAKDARAARFWAQSGNAWLAAGDAAKARAALDTALTGGGLIGLERGEAHLDRARSLVAAGDTVAAREDIDAALADAGDDPLAWLLSATLARRTGDLPRARTDIGKALERASDDASVQLEAGNIAALSGDEAGARGGWTRAAQTGQGAVAASAKAALAQFEAGK
ncbi:tetratricopeptide repeat protein [uncultured Sphingomonas sp.]|uniref:tetratricopeptide repeat protein n=1 Tax=uncultured Sphingomonas sp. TaxID=158754 RepID=UPI0025F5573D|nr:tetratricopeptide repeat protein [uncultured Sphingomonas sp.]